jgi:hypothetical protein
MISRATVYTRRSVYIPQVVPKKGRPCGQSIKQQNMREYEKHELELEQLKLGKSAKHTF